MLSEILKDLTFVSNSLATVTWESLIETLASLQFDEKNTAIALVAIISNLAACTAKDLSNEKSTPKDILNVILKSAQGQLTQS